MATSTIDIDIAIKTADANKSVKEIKDSLIALKAVKIDSAQFEEAQKAATIYREKLDDLKDSAKAASGSGVEKLSSSLNLLKEGFANADPGKIGIGFKALGAAMSALPIFLLIEGLKLVWDNLDKVTGFLNGSTAALKAAETQYNATTMAATNLGKQLQREVDLLTAQGASEKEILELKKKKLQQDLIAAEAAYKLNNAKLLDVKVNDSLYESYLRLASGVARFMGNTQVAEDNERALALNKQERAAEFIKGEEDTKNAILDIRNQMLVLDAAAQTKANKKWSELNKKAQDDKKKAAEEEWKAAVAESERLGDVDAKAAEKEHQLILKHNKQNRDAEIQGAEDAVDIAEKMYADLEKARQEYIDGIKKGFDIIKSVGADTNNALIMAFTDNAGAFTSALIEFDKAGATAEEKMHARVAAIQAALSAAIAIVDELFRIQEEKRQAALDKELKSISSGQQSQEVELKRQLERKLITQEQYEKAMLKIQTVSEERQRAARKKAFEAQKKAKLSQLIIDTFVGSSQAFLSAMSLPYPANLIAGGIAAGIVNAQGVIAYNNVKNSKFEDTAGGGGGSSSVGGFSSSDSGASSGGFNGKALQQVGSGEIAPGDERRMIGTDGTGTEPIRAYVVSQDMTNQQDADAIIERHATFIN